MFKSIGISAIFCLAPLSAYQHNPIILQGSTPVELKQHFYEMPMHRLLHLFRCFEQLYPRTMQCALLRLPGTQSCTDGTKGTRPFENPAISCRQNGGWTNFLSASINSQNTCHFSTYSIAAHLFAHLSLAPYPKCFHAFNHKSYANAQANVYTFLQMQHSRKPETRAAAGNRIPFACSVLASA